jgi:hypothetical protein
MSTCKGFIEVILACATPELLAEIETKLVANYARVLNVNFRETVALEKPDDFFTFLDRKICVLKYDT